MPLPDYYEKLPTQKKLYELARGARIYGLMPEGDPNGVIIFDHVDGMYSYCTWEGHEDRGVIHLAASTPLERDGDGWVIARGRDE